MLGSRDAQANLGLIPRVFPFKEISGESIGDEVALARAHNAYCIS